MKNNIPAIQVRGIRQTLPPGYVVGRTSTGYGPAELIPWSGVAGKVVNSGQVYGPGSPQPVEWNAGTVSALGTGVAINSGTLNVTQEWSAGTVSALGTGVAINSGTINVTQEWSAGTVSAIGTGLTVSSGTISATGGSSEWSAGTVSALGTGLAIVGTPQTTTWNPSDTGGDVTFSNGDLTLTSTGGSWVTTRATQNTSAGKWYFESVITANGTAGGSNGDWAIGYTPTSASLSSYLGHAAGIGYYPYTGIVILGGGVAATYQTGTTGNTVQIAVDFTNNLIWFNVNNGNWNDSGTANPATGTGGLSLSGIGTGPFAPAWSSEGGDATTVTNFGATSFTYTAPSGFTAWTYGGTPTLTPQWEAGTVTAIGTNLSLSSGTLSASASGLTLPQVLSKVWSGLP